MTDMKKPAQGRANPNNTSAAAHEHYSTAALAVHHETRNPLQEPVLHAMARDIGGNPFGNFGRVAALSSQSRRQTRKALEKEGLSPDTVRDMLKAMGYDGGRS